jgi:hypothetical protein
MLRGEKLRSHKPEPRANSAKAQRTKKPTAKTTANKPNNKQPKHHKNKPAQTDTLIKEHSKVMLGLPVKGLGFHLIPFRTQKLNRVPFPAVVWS